MAFWSGERLALELPKLILTFDSSRIDCASYKLCVGSQVFATSDKFQTAAPTDPVVSVLDKSAPNNILRIRPGQFAFILTEETVSVPTNAFALISMSTRFKFKGLINVSGFHVDPGWSGQLLFTVYNAGPAEIMVERGHPMFLIVYADLDQKSSMVFGTGAPGLSLTKPGQNAIRPELLQNMTEQVFSPLMLQRRIEDIREKMGSLETDLHSKMRSVEGTASLFKNMSLGVTTGVALLFAGAALFATFAPATLGIILARMMETGGYEMRLKPAESCPSTVCADAAVRKSIGGASAPASTAPATASVTPIPADATVSGKK